MTHETPNSSIPAWHAIEAASTGSTPSVGPLEARTAPIVAQAARERVRDAEALLRVVAWPDEPAGVRVIDLAGDLDHWGLSHGSGHRLARAHGHDRGIAVLVSVRRLLARWLAMFPETGNPAVALEVAAAYARPIEQMAAHEVAHALTSPIDDPLADDDVQVGLLRRLAVSPAEICQVTPEADGHGAAWAAGAAILYQRAAKLRPASAAAWHGAAGREFDRYGIDYESVARQVAHIGDDEPLRGLLADPVWLARIEYVIPPLAERARLIAARKAQRNSGAADGPPATVDDPLNEKDGAPC